MGRFYWILPLFLQILLWIPTQILLKCFSRFRVYGHRNLTTISPKRGIIFVANHASELDPPVVNAALPFLSVYIPFFFASDEPRFFKDTKKFGWRTYIYKPFFFRALGAYSVYVGQNNLKKALRHQIELLVHKKSLLFFPEGMITPDGKLGSARRGIAFLLHHTSTVIVPVGISGTYEISLKTFLSRRHTITVRFGKPIYRKDIFKENENPSLRDFKNGAMIIMSEVKKLLH